MEGLSSSNTLATFLILIVFTSIVNSSSGARHAAGQKSIEFIKTSCSSTSYPTLCYTSLASHARLIQTSPKLLANTALSVTLHTARSTSAIVVKMSHTQGLKPREVGAMRDCVEVLSDSVDQLRRSIGEMNQIRSSNFGLTINDVETWVSAALTNEDTCTDGVAENALKGDLKTLVRTLIRNLAHLTSNALALVNSYASLQND